MRRAGIGVAAILLLVTLIHGQSFKTEDSVEHSFAEGGKIYLSLGSGSYIVRAGDSNRIRANWRVEKAKDMDNIKVRVDITGAEARLQTSGPIRRADVVIEIPSRTDIYLRMRAGEIRIEGIEGNKDVSMTAGELRIDAEPASYSRVKASVTFGDLQAHPFQISKGGIARSFAWRGSGMYSLRASLFAGEINLVQRGRIDPRNP